MKIQDRMRLSVRRRLGHIVLRSELAALGSASQISHALKVLQRDGELIRLGAGVYAKAHKDKETGAIRPLVDFETLAQETASKLRMGVAPKHQDTAGAMKRLKWPSNFYLLDTGHRRVSRKLSLGDRTVAYINDRTRQHPVMTLSNGRLAIPTSGVAQFIQDLAQQFQFFIGRNDLLGNFTPVEVLTGACVSHSADTEAAEFFAKPHQERLEFVTSVARTLFEAHDS